MSIRPRAIVAEDEILLQDQLIELLGAAWPELEIAAIASDGRQAMKAMETYRPNVLFLDIQMPEASGLEVAKAASGLCHVVFVTAYDQYAVAAFEEGAVDYVMKPLSGKRVATAVERVKQRLRFTPANLGHLVDDLNSSPKAQGQYLRWINASRGDGVQLVTIEEVRYFQSDTKYTRVVAERCDGLIRKTLKDLMQELDPSVFWQIHRSTIVNLNAVERVGRDIRGNVVLHLRDVDEVLKVSQPFAYLFRQM
jgi:DNA-binding LytR/AlgR family response regulator